jgi:hypothetical protein
MHSKNVIESVAWLQRKRDLQLVCKLKAVEIFEGLSFMEVLEFQRNRYLQQELEQKLYNEVAALSDDELLKLRNSLSEQELILASVERYGLAKRTIALVWKMGSIVASAWKVGVVVVAIFAIVYSWLGFH